MFNQLSKLARRSALSSSWKRLASNRAQVLQYAVNHDDLQFVLHDVYDVEKHYKEIGYDLDVDMIDSLMGESAKFCEQELVPMLQSGDAQGCVRDDDGNVTTPEGWKAAYQTYAEAGWQGLSVLEKYGGQGMPQSLSLIKAEFIGTANWTWGMYPGLAMGAANTLVLHGSEEQKQTYLTKLAEGTWLGTMCLTEPHCGTDLGQMKTKAEPVGDGSYKITGTKIFISCGEHDWTDNIIHIVLARLPNAPEGTKGISLFIVPKYQVKEDGSLDSKRNIMCGGIESKMGIHGSSTCTMNFDGSIGYLIGEPNNGLKQMFTFMNTARLGTAIQGLGAMELAYQNSVWYAKERMSGRAFGGVTHPERPADALIAHGDVRRMLMTQRAFAEGGRALLYDVAKICDHIYKPNQTEAGIKEVENWLGLFTPVCKGFLTEIGQDCASLGIQMYGGHGFIVENGMEQIYRDARIGTLYEGTTGIQALDLLGRKVMLNKGKLLNKYVLATTKECFNIMKENPNPTSRLFKRAARLQALLVQWNYLTVRLMARAASGDKEVISSAANDYMYFSGYVMLAHQWLRMTDVATKKLSEGGRAPKEFYEAKLATSDFYFEHLLPKAKGHAAALTNSSKTTMKLKEDWF